MNENECNQYCENNNKCDYCPLGGFWAVEEIDDLEQANIDYAALRRGG